MDKYTQINFVLKEYFDHNKTVKIVAAKDMMPYFVLAGIFSKDIENGLPIRNLINDLERKNLTKNIPYLFADKKLVYTKWYFQSKKKTVQDLLKIEQKIRKAKAKSKKNAKKATKSVPKKAIQPTLELIFPKS